MPATVTLSTTTLTKGLDARSGSVFVASTSGLFPGTRLYADGELMAVNRVVSSTEADVRRGVDGTSGMPHSSSAVVTIGSADQFYSSDPVGAPASAIPVSPYINAIGGKVFYAQGDVAQRPGQEVNRWWQDVTTAYGIGALGVRTVVSDPTSST